VEKRNVYSEVGHVCFFFSYIRTADS